MIFDFSAADVTRLVIFDLETAAGARISDATVRLGIQIQEAVADDFDWGDKNQGDITVQAWSESEASNDY